MPWVVDRFAKNSTGDLALVARIEFMHKSSAELYVRTEKSIHVYPGVQWKMYWALKVVPYNEPDTRPERERLSRIMMHISEDGNAALHRNLHKPDNWMDDKLIDLGKKLLLEVLELVEAQSPEHQREEIGDCEAYLAMIADWLNVYEER